MNRAEITRAVVEAEGIAAGRDAELLDAVWLDGGNIPVLVIQYALALRGPTPDPDGGSRALRETRWAVYIDPPSGTPGVRLAPSASGVVETRWVEAPEPVTG